MNINYIYYFETNGFKKYGKISYLNLWSIKKSSIKHKIMDIVLPLILNIYMQIGSFTDSYLFIVPVWQKNHQKPNYAVTIYPRAFRRKSGDIVIPPSVRPAVRPYVCL